MSHRPLALLSGLTLGDYLLWNWSLNGNHDLLALAAGLSLPPLALACLVLLAVNAGRVIARSARHARALAHDRGGAGRGPQHRAGRSATTTGSVDQPPAPVTNSRASSPGKLAA